MRNYESGASLPSSDLLESICKKLRISAEWLLLGEGPTRHAELSGTAPGTAFAEIPVVGLAACGLAGWYNPSHLAISAQYPFGTAASGMFAVIAVGESMIPDGIRQGHLLFCNPHAPLEDRDAIFVEKKDGTVAIKQYAGKNEEWLLLQGWLDPDDKGQQKPYQEKLAMSSIKQIAVVVATKRRA